MISFPNIYCFFSKTYQYFIFSMLIVMISGKRKSGKDFVASKLYKHFGEDSRIIRLSAPLKKAFATENNLDYENLLTSGMYKELYRKVTNFICVFRYLES